jgi:hypothetical protein
VYCATTHRCSMVKRSALGSFPSVHLGNCPMSKQGLRSSRTTASSCEVRTKVGSKD